MRKTCLDVVYELAKTDERIFFIGSDLGVGTLDDFRKEMPERFFMEGVSEANVVEHGRRPRARRQDRLRQHHRHLPDPALLRAGRARSLPAQRQGAADCQRRWRGLRAARADASRHRRSRHPPRDPEHDHRRAVRRERDAAPGAADRRLPGPGVHPAGQRRRSDRLVGRRAVPDRPRHSHGARRRCAARDDGHHRQGRRSMRRRS